MNEVTTTAPVERWHECPPRESKHLCNRSERLTMTLTMHNDSDDDNDDATDDYDDDVNNDNSPNNGDGGDSVGGVTICCPQRR
jgi:hypothetical protein